MITDKQESKLVEIRVLAAIGGYRRIWKMADMALSGSSIALDRCVQIGLVK